MTCSIWARQVCPPMPLRCKGLAFAVVCLSADMAQNVADGRHAMVQVIIDWDAATRTAMFIWRGSITQQDWLQVLNAVKYVVHTLMRKCCLLDNSHVYSEWKQSRSGAGGGEVGGGANMQV